MLGGIQDVYLGDVRGVHRRGESSPIRRVPGGLVWTRCRFGGQSVALAVSSAMVLFSVQAASSAVTKSRLMGAAGAALDDAEGVVGQQVSWLGRSARVVARATAASARCPDCGTVSRRVHSRYERQLQDTAADGCEVVICLIVRRFRCLSPECGKSTFAEQVDGLTSRHARRTPAATAVLQAVALALGGRAGARLSGRLAAGVSRMTMIRLVRAMPLPTVSASPRVAGRERVRAAQRAPLPDAAGRRRDPPARRHPGRAVGGLVRRVAGGRPGAEVMTSPDQLADTGKASLAAIPRRLP